jgi:cytochrome P450
LPLLGSVLRYRRDLLDYLLELERRYGRMATIRIGRTPVVLLFRPEHVRYVLVENPRNFTNREVAGGLVYGKLLVLTLLSRTFSKKVAYGLHDVIGDNLITTDGDVFRDHRRLLQPAFSKARVSFYADLIVECTQERLGHWRVGAEIDFVQQMQSLILRILMKILVGVDVERESGDFEVTGLIERVLEQTAGLLDGVLNVRVDLPVTPYGKRMAAVRNADAYLYGLIERRRAEKSDAGDVLSMLLEAHEEWSDSWTIQHVRDELIAAIAGGYETTTNSIAWTFYLLARYPDALEQLLRELDTVLAGRPPRPDNLPHLSYLDRVVKESMRLYPAAWTLGRRAENAFELDGYRFPAGTLIMFSQWVLHRLPDVWEDADAFRPDRWNGLAGDPMLRWAYFPFGRGSRMCIGASLAELEIRLILATILQRYVPAVAREDRLEPLPLITLWPTGGLPLTLAAKPASA